MDRQRTRTQSSPPSNPAPSVEDARFQNTELVSSDASLSSVLAPSLALRTALNAVSNEVIKQKLQRIIAVLTLNLESAELLGLLKPALSMARSNEQVAVFVQTLAKELIEAGHPAGAALLTSLADMSAANSLEKAPSRTIVKPTPISGFLEFPPEYQLHLDEKLESIRRLFALHGFVPIDTPVVEKLEVLAAKGGDVDKELYLLSRSHGEGELNESQLALRYDLTVPFARYVARHFDNISFPFKRYHIGDCWRGERPQDGRYRQFKQADIDVVNLDRVPLSFDADIPIVVNEAIQTLGVEDYVFRMSNRKILSGYLQGLGIENTKLVTRYLDKLDKIGPQAVVSLLVEQAGLTEPVALQALKLAEVKSRDVSFVDRVRELGVSTSVLEQGLEELAYVIQRVEAQGCSNFVADLSITRGFDYYTGSVYEVRWNKFPGIGSIAAGGRYEDLASNYINRHLPGVGMSIGISRIYGKMVQTGAVQLPKRTSTKLLVAWPPGFPESELHALAGELRRRGVNVEVYHADEGLQKQVRYADRKGIPLVVFPDIREIKDMVSGKQSRFTPEQFSGGDEKQ